MLSIVSEVRLISEAETPNVRRIPLRYESVCCVCGISLSRRTEAMWDRSAKTVTCLACAPSATRAEPGAAGASAAAEGTGRRDTRIEEVRRKHGDHAAEVAKEMAERDNAATWGKGSKGESRLAAFVEREVAGAVIPLHDRLIPGTRGNIDHIFASRPAASGLSTRRPTTGSSRSARSARSGDARTRSTSDGETGRASRRASRSR